MRPLCPFNSEAYVAGLTNIGVPERHKSGRFSILRRPIAGTAFCDGAGPWPYLWVDGSDDIRALREDFHHLVSLTVVVQPGYVPRDGDDAVLLKQHFVYDPALPPPPLSRRARARLRRCEEIAGFEIVTDLERRLRMVEIYDGLIRRRDLTGRYVDFPARHFESIAGLDCGVFFAVNGPDGIGAMACGVLYGGMLQILHTAISAEGLRWNASYLLMAELQRYAKERQIRMLTGGMPDGGSDGLRVFKERWANRFEPVYLLRIVGDRARYAALCAGRSLQPSFFPAYRAPA